MFVFCSYLYTDIFYPNSTYIPRNPEQNHCGVLCSPTPLQHSIVITCHFYYRSLSLLAGHVFEVLWSSQDSIRGISQSSTRDTSGRVPGWGLGDA